MAADDVRRESLAPVRTESSALGGGGERAGGRYRVRSCAGKDAGCSAVASGDVSELSQKSEREGTEIDGGLDRGETKGGLTRSNANDFANKLFLKFNTVSKLTIQNYIM
jgi:hypothetical protein